MLLQCAQEANGLWYTTCSYCSAQTSWLRICTWFHCGGPEFQLSWPATQQNVSARPNFHISLEPCDSKKASLKRGFLHMSLWFDVREKACPMWLWIGKKLEASAWPLWALLNAYLFLLFLLYTLIHNLLFISNFIISVFF